MHFFMQRSSTHRFQIPPYDIQVDESKKAAKPTLDLSWVVVMAWIRARKCSPFPEIIQPG
jgi:hypothetical protein